MPAERCNQLQGMPTQPALCVEVCCDYMDNGPRAALMSNGECQAKAGASNPDLCDSTVCCGLADGGFREMTAAECTALDRPIVQAALCEDDNDGAGGRVAPVGRDANELVAASADAGVGGGANAADGGSQGSCSVAPETQGPLGPIVLFSLLGVCALRRRRNRVRNDA